MPATAVVAAAALVCASVAAASQPAPPLESLPMPARDIPTDLDPPLNHGRNDVHGWLWLPIEDGSVGVEQPVSTLHAWFYHHTPEFWFTSQHNFEIMVAATLQLDHAVDGLPLPPAAETMGTEYVFTPPAFSLDDFITGEAKSFYGHFTNGSFDTPQYIWLSNGTLTVEDTTTVHYLWDDNHTSVSPMDLQAYLSYPRRLPTTARTGAAAADSNVVGRRSLSADGHLRRALATPSSSSSFSSSFKTPADSNSSSNTDSTNSSLHHLYWLHVLRRAPDYDQIVHVTLDSASCTWRHGDSEADIGAVGATFGTDLDNDVMNRLHAIDGDDNMHTVRLFTNRSRAFDDTTTCNVTVLREVHCVIMPDSFATCPKLEGGGGG